MYLRLKADYIIKHSPTKPMLINTFEDTQITISQSESIILSLLDGSNDKQKIRDIILSELQIFKEEEKRIVISNINSVINHFSSFIDFLSAPESRNNFVFGDLNYEYPYELSIELTDKCLLECKHCYKDASSCKHTSIDTSKLLSFLEQSKNKVHTIQLTGGEAMMHPDFWAILDYCKKHFCQVIVSTTGLLLNDRNVEYLNGTKVYISLYSFNSEANKDYVGKDVLSEILSSIKLLKANNIHVCINTIVSDQNIDNLQNFIKKCEELNVDGVGLGKNVLVGRAKQLSCDERCSKRCEECVKTIEDNFISEKMYLSTFLTDSLPKEIQCGYYKWIINEKGHILPCAFFPEQFTLGTISDSIEMVFNLHKFEDMINNLKKLAIDMKKNGEKITDICEVLYLVEEEQVTA